MKIFQCDNCKHPLYFENDTCENCNHLTGFRDEDRKMLSFNPFGEFLISERYSSEYKYCQNHEYGACNWLLEKNDDHVFCRACQLNRKLPNLFSKKNFERWKSLEIAKHRLIFQLQKIGLTLSSKNHEEGGFCFDFVSKKNNPGLMTGHANGVITILLREADSVLREQTRKELLEPYRTLIGHLRHEVGHYFWDRLVFTNGSILDEFRAIFGDERKDYSQALKRYYVESAPENWQESFISKYATAHPWEDWAETWAHYLHVMDMVETAYFFDLHVNHKGSPQGFANVSFDPYTINDFDVIINTSVPLSFAVNSINRAMGLPDVYPFVITPGVIVKMKFIHKLLLPKRNQ